MKKVGVIIYNIFQWKMVGKHPVMCKSKIFGVFCLFAGIFLLASNFIGIRYVSPHMGPWHLAFFRFGFAFLTLLPATVHLLYRHRKTIWRYRWPLLFEGLTGVTLTAGFAAEAMRSTTALDAGFIFSFSPLMIIVMARLILKEPFTQRQWLGVGIMFFGVLCIIFKGSVLKLFNFHFALGDLWVLAAAFSYAVFTILVKKYKSEIPPLTATVALIIMGLLCLLPPFLVDLLQGYVLPAGLDIWLALAFVGVMGSALGYFLYIKGTEISGARVAGILTYLMPLCVALQARIILKESLQWYHLIAAVTVLLGLLLCVTRQRDEAARTNVSDNIATLK